MAAIPKNVLDNYNVRSNTTDLTTIKVDRDNPAFLVDKKLIDIFISKLSAISFDEFKESLLKELSLAGELDTLITVFNDKVYLHTVIDKFNSLNVKETTGLEETQL